MRQCYRAAAAGLAILGCGAFLSADGQSPPTVSEQAQQIQPLNGLCATQEVWEAKQFGQPSSAVGGVCPLEGVCDDPLVRDSYIIDSSVLYKTVRVHLHVFREDDGSDAAADPKQIEGLIDTLQADYEAYRVRFDVTWGFVDDTEFRYSPSVSEMKETYAVNPATTCNVYITQYGGGVGTFPWDSDALTEQGGIVLGNQHASSGNHVLTHEMGHNLGLWHTHHGVDEVDFCEACYESPDAGTGDVTGDFCSDTRPEPANFGVCADPGTVDDCSGDPWGSTPRSNYMSYGSGNGVECWDHFTTQQISRMHCWIEAMLTTWLTCDSTLDCNGNGIPDDCDIQEGYSPDENRDSIPDECATCPQDVTGDMQRDVLDLLQILGSWGDCEQPCPPKCGDDTNSDCSVDVLDMLNVLSNWGPCQTL